MPSPLAGKGKAEFQRTVTQHGSLQFIHALSRKGKGHNSQTRAN